MGDDEEREDRNIFIYKQTNWKKGAELIINDTPFTDRSARARIPEEARVTGERRAKIEVVEEERRLRRAITEVWDA